MEFLACVWKDATPEGRERTAVAILNAAIMRRPTSVHEPPVQLAGGNVRVFGDVDKAAFPCADRFEGIGLALGGFRGNLGQPVHVAVQKALRAAHPELGAVSE